MLKFHGLVTILTKMRINDKKGPFMMIYKGNAHIWAKNGQHTAGLFRNEVAAIVALRAPYAKAADKRSAGSRRVYGARRATIALGDATRWCGATKERSTTEEHHGTRSEATSKKQVRAGGRPEGPDTRRGHSAEGATGNAPLADAPKGFHEKCHLAHWALRVITSICPLHEVGNYNGLFLYST